MQNMDFFLKTILGCWGRGIIAAGAKKNMLKKVKNGLNSKKMKYYRKKIV